MNNTRFASILTTRLADARSRLGNLAVGAKIGLENSNKTSPFEVNFIRVGACPGFFAGAGSQEFSLYLGKNQAEATTCMDTLGL